MTATRQARRAGPAASGRGGGRIAVLLPYVWSVRNVVYAGVLDRLANSGADVHLIMRHGAPPADAPAAPSFTAAGGIHELFVPTSRPVRGKALLDAVVRSAFNRRYRIASYPIYRRWFERRNGAALRARSAIVETLGALARHRAVFGMLERWTERRYRASNDLGPIRAQLERIAPDVLWSTFCVTPLEYGYYLAARDLGIPVVTSILSFDNLTSRSVIPRYDHYLVWHAGMRDQLRRLYPDVPASRISITGTPQFDFHCDPAYRGTREDALRRLGLPADARYMLYAASFVGLAPDEPQLVAQLARRMRERETLRDLWLVVRIHPLETMERWRPVVDASPRVVVQTAWEMPPDADGWTLSSPSDQARLVGTLAHAEACVNVASTMSLDAAILDRPAIGIDFSSEADAPREIMYEEYGVEHYRPLVERGGVRVATSWAELLGLIEGATTEPARDRACRADTVVHECGLVDGHAADRVAAALLSIMELAAHLDRDVEETRALDTALATRETM